MSGRLAFGGRQTGLGGVERSLPVDPVDEFWQCFSTFTGRSLAERRAAIRPLPASASEVNFSASLGLSPSRSERFGL